MDSIQRSDVEHIAEARVRLLSTQIDAKYREMEQRHNRDLSELRREFASFENKQDWRWMYMLPVVQGLIAIDIWLHRAL